MKNTPDWSSATWTGEISDSVIQLHCTGRDDAINLLTLLTPTELRRVCPMTAVKTSLSVYLGLQTFAAASWAAVRLHFYKRWQLMKSLKRRERKKRFCHFISFCVSTNLAFRVSEYWFFFFTLIIHYFMWSFLSLAFPFITEQNMFPAFCPAVKLPFYFVVFLMTHAEKSSNPILRCEQTSGQFPTFRRPPRGISDGSISCSFRCWLSRQCCRGDLGHWGGGFGAGKL